MKIRRGKNSDKTSLNRDEEFHIRQGRISSIETMETEKKTFPYKPVVILSVIALVLVGSIFLITKFIGGPNSFLSKDNIHNLPIDVFEREMKTASQNVHLKKGIESYKRGYFTDAISEFNEVVESDAPNKDKASALNFIGMIHDERGKHDKAIEFFNRAVNYDSNNPDIYRNMSLAYRSKKDFSKALESVEKSLSINDDDSNSRILMGNLYYQQGKYDAALDQYNEALEKNPNQPGILFNKASVLMKKGDEFAAIEYYEKAGTYDKIGEVAHKAFGRLGTLYLQRNSYSEAEKYLKKAVEIRPANATNRYNLGLAYLKQKKTDLAISELTKAEELGSNNVAMLENIGDAYLNLKDYDKSLSTYKKALKTNTRNVRILSNVAEIYYHKGQLDESYNMYKKITSIAPATEHARIAYLNMGNILDDSERYSEAIAMYNKALSLNEKDDSALYNLGLAYKHAGQPERAINAWKKAIRLNPNEPRHRMAIANYYYDKNLYDLAENEYQDILTKWPQIQEGHFKMATIYYKRGNLQYAIKAYKNVIDINDRSDLARIALINSGLLYSRTDKDGKGLAKSKLYINKALQLKPNDVEALYAMGIVNAKGQLFDKAINNFYQVLRGTSDNKLLAKAYNSIGRCYYKEKKYRKAIQSFTRGIEEDPLNEEIRMNRKVANQAYEAELAND